MDHTIGENWYLQKAIDLHDFGRREAPPVFVRDNPLITDGRSFEELMWDLMRLLREVQQDILYRKGREGDVVDL